MEAIKREDFLKKHGRAWKTKKKRPDLKIIQGDLIELHDALKSLRSNKETITEHELKVIRGA